jgi:hypothetical protein
MKRNLDDYEWDATEEQIECALLSLMRDGEVRMFCKMDAPEEERIIYVYNTPGAAEKFLDRNPDYAEMSASVFAKVGEHAFGKGWEERVKKQKIRAWRKW